MRKLFFLVVSHSAVLAIGFALGVYLLPIITAPPSPDAASLEEMAADALFEAEFLTDLPGNDLLHWGEGTVSLSRTQIVHRGKLAPGPDYKLYLLNQLVEHEDEFLPLKANATLVGDIKTFGGFVVDIPSGVDVSDYSTVLVWCESFSEFITVAQFQ